MLIVSHEFKETDNWQFHQLPFGRTNLFVGKSGSGKTRVLNTIFNIGRFVASDSRCLSGKWCLEIRVGNEDYRWEYHGDRTDDSAKPFVVSEKLSKITKGKEEVLLERSLETQKFQGRELPKMPKESTFLHILKEEDAIKPIYDGFCGITRRNFFSDELDKAARFEPIARSTLDILDKKASLDSLSNFDMGLNAKLYLLNKFFPDKFKELTLQFRRVFPEVKAICIKKITEGSGFRLPFDYPIKHVPVLEEEGVKKPLLLSDLSSGMLKVLLVLTDILTFPSERIYLLDEYENSLGVNAINFLPELLADFEGEHQFFITSHHPYLINNIPVKNWFVFHREGSVVKIQSGDMLVEKFGTSKQQAFIKLLNDPFFSEGVE